MLDVHPPHHSPNTWRDFFLHIATIVVGLCIAVGIEQTVELFHHRHQAHHARELIVEEVRHNQSTLAHNLDDLTQHEAWLQNDLAVLDRLRTHKLTSDDHLLFVRPSSEFSDSAWTTAHESGAAAYLPYEDLIFWEHIYKNQKTIDGMSIDAKNDIVRSTSALNNADGPRHLSANELRGAVSELSFKAIATIQSKDLLRLSPEQIDQLRHGFQLALSEDDQMMRWYIALEGFFRELPPQDK